MKAQKKQEDSEFEEDLVETLKCGSNLEVAGAP